MEGESPIDFERRMMGLPPRKRRNLYLECAGCGSHDVELWDIKPFRTYRCRRCAALLSSRQPRLKLHRPAGNTAGNL